LPVASDPIVTANTRPMHFLLGDQVGATQTEFSSGGRPVWQGQFTPFGQELDTQTSANTYKYASLERDTETGFDNAMPRLLNSSAGRWMSPDPYDGSMDVSNPQTFNRYSYVNNMPLNFSDSSGLEGGGCGFVCGVVILGDALITLGLDSLFDHPKLTASQSQRPNARIWDEHGSYQPHNQSITDILGLSSDGCEFGVCNFQQNGNLTVYSDSIFVFCRGIEHPIPHTSIPLGTIGAQHCDALVSLAGKLSSISAGPDPPDGPNQVLRQYVSPANGAPSGSVYYYQGRGSAGLGACLIGQAQAMHDSPARPAYNAVYGPNSNNYLNQVFAGCGVNLGLHTHGPFY
jgi:RHS repeat-associated protein